MSNGLFEVKAGIVCGRHQTLHASILLAKMLAIHAMIRASDARQLSKIRSTAGLTEHLLLGKWKKMFEYRDR